jgi:hypothetical protein
MTIILPNARLIEQCIQKGPWDLGNKVLYDLCANNFTHDDDEKIIAKVWLIGRSYAAAIERRKNKKESDQINDNFYTDTVVNYFKNSRIDTHLSYLSNATIIENKIPTILKTHRYLMDIVNKITDLDKRSFCSKYLHFHLPKLYFMYDSRAVYAIQQFIKKLPIQMTELIDLDTVDKEYGKFFCKCYILQQEILQETGTLLAPRQLDNLLIAVANDKQKRRLLTPSKTNCASGTV